MSRRPSALPATAGVWLSLCLAVGAFLGTSHSWAQATDPNNDPSLTLSADEETAVDPLYDGASDSAADPDPVSSDTPSDTDVDAPLPPPPPDWDLNDQGGYDPHLGNFTVYMGTIGGYKPFTHHGEYVQRAKNWFTILTARPTVCMIMLRYRVKAFEIRYWYDPIPGPVDYVAHMTAYTFDGSPLADIYFLNADGLDYRLDELEEFFGRPILITPCRFHVGLLPRGRHQRPHRHHHPHR